jgi:thiol-disulfide isomerase/thioredoxin
MKRYAFCLAVLLLFAGAAAAQAEPLDLSRYRGKVVYLDFWASWCTPCHLSFPWMNEMQQTYGREGFAVIAVDLDRDRHAADAFLAESRGALDIVYDPRGEIAKQFNFRDMPTAILIGRDGRVRATHSGFVTNQEGAYQEDVVQLLHEKAP